MAEFDRQLAFWLAMGTLGLIGFALAFLGEFVFGWWKDLGEWIAWGTAAFTVFAFVTAASRFQLRDVAGDVKDIKESSRRIEANTSAISRIEANTSAISRIEANTSAISRIEANTSAISRIEANTSRIPRMEENIARMEGTSERIEQHTSESVLLLRQIRDRLPPPG